MPGTDSSTGVLLIGAISVAGLHALIPSHWLAFALIGRSQRWSVRRTIGVTVLAGAGHVLMTIVLGIVLATVGKALLHALPAAVEHAATGGILILLGLYFAWPAIRGKQGCRHHHAHAYPLPGEPAHSDHEDAAAHGSSEPETERIARVGSAPTIIGALVMGLTLSPCLDLLSIYVPAFLKPWPVVVGMSFVMLFTTVGTMALLVRLTLAGMTRLNLGWLERHEGAAVGGLLILLGLLLFIVKF